MSSNPIAPADVRTAYPEFSDTTAYPDAQIQFYINMAYAMLNQCRWAEWLVYGATLFVCHHLALARTAAKAAAGGGVPGTGVGGPVSSKSVDKVSVGYDVAAGSEEGAGFWNLSTYGKEYYRLSRQIGAGPVQIPTFVPFDPLSSANAWPGPDTSPGWFGS